MPCGTSARLTAYVAYQNLAFAERDVLVAALTNAGYTDIDVAQAGSEANNPLTVCDSSGRVVAAAAVVVRASHLPNGFGDLGLVMVEGAYVPLLPSDARSPHVLKSLRLGYGRAKATQLADQARRRYGASVRRSVSADGSVTIRVRF